MTFNAVDTEETFGKILKKVKTHQATNPDDRKEVKFEGGEGETQGSSLGKSPSKGFGAVAWKKLSGDPMAALKNKYNLGTSKKQIMNRLVEFEEKKRMAKT